MMTNVANRPDNRGAAPERPFSSGEYSNRISRLRAVMRENGMDALLVFSPENIFYLTGLNHLGFFSPHILVIPAQGKPTLVARAMEAATVDAQLENIQFAGHGDGETPGEKAVQALKEMKLASAALGIEKHSLFSPIHLWETLKENLPGVSWADGSDLVDRLRMVKSAAEIQCIREASKISAKMMAAVCDTATEGASESQVAAEAMRAMAAGGGEIPGFGPFIRATPSMAQEHVAFGNYRLKKNDMLLVELSGCYHRYHAPVGRLFFIGEVPEATRKAAAICEEAFDAVLASIKPGKTADDAYRAWQSVVDNAGLAHYRRHHCGYMVGIGFPPSWVGGGRVIGLRRGSDEVLKAGMTFHFLSWLLGCGAGDYLITDTVVLHETGAEALRQFPVSPRAL